MATTQSAIEPICHPLSAVCTYLTMVSAYLYRKNFMSSVLAPPVVTENTQIRFAKAILEDKHITSDPLVTYKCEGYAMGITPYGTMTTPKNNPSSLNSSISFTVNTTSDIFTEALAFEIGAFSMAVKNLLHPHQMWINRVDVSETSQDTKSTFYLAKTKVNFFLGYPIWNTTELEGMLREVRIEVNPK